MKSLPTQIYSGLSLLLILTGCSSSSEFVTTNQTIHPGGQLRWIEESVHLHSPQVSQKKNFRQLIEQTLRTTIKPQVTLVSIVPSIDTPVCEQQTHLLGETEQLDPQVERITISSDLPYAQKRFAKAAKLEMIQYLSDYRNGEFGKASGLMIREKHLLARAVFVLRKNGTIAHSQIVPEITQLPNMQKAINIANQLIQSGKVHP